MMRNNRYTPLGFRMMHWIMQYNMAAQRRANMCRISRMRNLCVSRNEGTNALNGCSGQYRRNISSAVDPEEAIQEDTAVSNICSNFGIENGILKNKHEMYFNYKPEAAGIGESIECIVNINQEDDSEP